VTRTEDRNRRGVISRDEAVRWRNEQKRHGRRVVFTNGVFDLLHPGHVRYLTQARALGDVLIVAINSDRSVSKLAKGPARPLTPEAERAEIVGALAAVSAVVVFDEETPLDIVTTLRPDVLVKGADWGPGEIVGAEIVEADGGSVVRIPLAAGYSTTNLIEKIRR
jgi:D-beta-D-heptose 7-phosphate kinase/D-beta-D-heptose 1-phosphate adenosyltransferase